MKVMKEEKAAKGGGKENVTVKNEATLHVYNGHGTTLLLSLATSLGRRPASWSR